MLEHQPWLTLPAALPPAAVWCGEAQLDMLSGPWGGVMAMHEKAHAQMQALAGEQSGAASSLLGPAACRTAYALAAYADAQYAALSARRGADEQAWAAIVAEKRRGLEAARAMVAAAAAKTKEERLNVQTYLHRQELGLAMDEVR